MDSSLLKAQLYQSYERRRTANLPLSKWVKHNFDPETCKVFNRYDARRDALKLLCRAFVLVTAYSLLHDLWVEFLLAIVVGEIMIHAICSIASSGFYRDMCTLYQACRAAKKGGASC